MRTFLVILLFCAQQAWSKTIFEPNFTTTHGSFAGTINGSSSIANGTNVETTYTMFSGGFRYGISREYIHLTAVIDGYVSHLGTNQNVDTSLKFDANYGLGIGWEWNIPLRTYIILGFPHSALEMSYFYNETMLIGFRYTRLSMDFAGVDLAVNSYGVTLSFPIEFDYPDHWWRKREW